MVDLTQLSLLKADQEVAFIVGLESRLGFDLMRGPVIRARLVKLSSLDSVLAVTIHHIASDGWSMGVFVEELSKLYAAASTGLQAALPDLEIQYADYALWQRQWLEGDVLDKQLDYWKQELHAVPTVLELPTDRARPPSRDSKVALRHSGWNQK